MLVIDLIFLRLTFSMGFGCRSARNWCCHAAQQLPASTSATSSLRRLLQTSRWTSSSSKPLPYNPLTRVLIGRSTQRVSGFNDNQAPSTKQSSSSGAASTFFQAALGLRHSVRLPAPHGVVQLHVQGEGGSKIRVSDGADPRCT